MAKLNSGDFEVVKPTNSKPLNMKEYEVVEQTIPGPTTPEINALAQKLFSNGQQTQPTQPTKKPSSGASGSWDEKPKSILQNVLDTVNSGVNYVNQNVIKPVTENPVTKFITKEITPNLNPIGATQKMLSPVLSPVLKKEAELLASNQYTRPVGQFTSALINSLDPNKQNFAIGPGESFVNATPEAKTDVEKFAKGAGEFIGQTAVDLSLMALSSGTVAAPTMTKLLTKFPQLKDAKVLQQVISGALTAPGYTAIKDAALKGEIANPEEFARDLMFFTAAPVGSSLMKGVLGKVAPKLPNLIQKPLEGAAAGTLGLASTYPVMNEEEKKNFTSELGPTAAAMALFHTLGSAGERKPIPGEKSAPMTPTEKETLLLNAFKPKQADFSSQSAESVSLLDGISNQVKAARTVEKIKNGETIEASELDNPYLNLKLKQAGILDKLQKGDTISIETPNGIADLEVSPDGQTAFKLRESGVPSTGEQNLGRVETTAERGVVEPGGENQLRTTETGTQELKPLQNEAVSSFGDTKIIVTTSREDTGVRQKRKLNEFYVESTTPNEYGMVFLKSKEKPGTGVYTKWDDIPEQGKQILTNIKPPTEAVSSFKEPWQMTKDEYLYQQKSAWENQRKNFKPKAESITRVGMKNAQLPAWDYLQEMHSNQNHKKIVMEALSEGKPVPENILKEYGLQEQANKGYNITNETLEEAVGQSNTIKAPNKIYDPLYGRTTPSGERVNNGGNNPSGNLAKTEIISKSKPAQKAGFSDDSELYVAVEAYRKGKAWFKKEFAGIENPDAVFNELTSKFKTLTNKDLSQLKFDLQRFAMRDPKFGDNMKQTFKDNRTISQFRTNTIEKTTAFSKEAKLNLKPEEFEIIPKPEKESLAEAEKRVNDDYEGEMKKLMQKDAFTGSDFDTYMLIGQKLEAEAKQTGNYTEFSKWMSGGSLSANTEPARNLQAHVKYSRTPVGAVNEAQSAVNGVEREIKKKNGEVIKKVDRETKQVKKIIDDTQQAMNGKPKEQILKEIRRRLKQSMIEKPPRVKQTLYDKVIEAVRAGAYDDAQIRDLIKQSEKLPVLTPEDVKFIVEHMDKANNLPEGSGEQLREIYRVQKIIEDKSQVTLHDKVRGVMQIALLGRVKTFIRNFIGNPLFGGVDRLSEISNARIANWVFDTVSPKKLGQQFGGLLVNKEFGKGSAEGAKNVVNDIGGGWENYKSLPKDASIADILTAYQKDWMNRTDTSISRGQADLVKKRIFKNEAMQSTLDAIGYLLKAGDEPFVQGWKKQRIEELKRIKKTDKVTPEMDLEATMYALDKTFQNDSTAAEMMLKLRSVMNFVPFAGDVIIPFAKTPANIIDKTIEYTPVGLIKVVRDIGRMNRGDERFNPRQFVQRMGRVMTGTELLILGGVLFKSGIISGGGDKKSEKERSFDKMSGNQDYSFKLGNTKYSYDWADPTGTILATGADIMKNVSTSRDWLTALTALTQTTVNTLGKKSFMQGISKLTGYGDLGSGIAKTVMGVPSMFMPGTITQFAPLTDKYQRDTRDDNPLKETGKALLNKVPFANQTLPKRIDLFGEPIKNMGGQNNWFNVLVNPSNVIKTSDDPAVKFVAQVYQKTGDKLVIPRPAPKEITVDGKKYALNVAEQQKFQQIMGQSVKKQILDIASGSGDYDQKAKQLRSAVVKSYDDALDVMIQQKGIQRKSKSSFKFSF